MQKHTHVSESTSGAGPEGTPPPSLSHHFYDHHMMIRMFCLMKQTVPLNFIHIGSPTAGAKMTPGYIWTQHRSWGVVTLSPRNNTRPRRWHPGCFPTYSLERPRQGCWNFTPLPCSLCCSLWSMQEKGLQSTNGKDKHTPGHPPAPPVINTQTCKRC